MEPEAFLAVTVTLNGVPAVRVLLPGVMVKWSTTKPVTVNRRPPGRPPSMMQRSRLPGSDNRLVLGSHTGGRIVGEEALVPQALDQIDSGSGVRSTW